MGKNVARETYSQIVDRGAHVMARILEHTSNTTTVHALAEKGKLSADLFLRIAECASQHPDQDIVIYVQRVDWKTIKEALRKPDQP